MQQIDIDIDFRRVVVEYWKTFEDDGRTADVLENIRGTLMQWFEGEGQATALRRDFGVQKMVKKENARIFLASLGKFVRWLGFRGLLVLLDESEMSHSTMRRSSLKKAHNNLLHLINEAESVEGLVLLYAAVPEFFDDPKYGIKTYGASRSASARWKRNSRSRSTRSGTSTTSHRRQTHSLLRRARFAASTRLRTPTKPPPFRASPI